MSLSLTSALTPEHLAFVAAYVANGNNASKAVAQVWPMLPLESVTSKAIVLMRNKALVSAIENAMEETSFGAVKSLVLSKEEKLQLLARRVRHSGPIKKDSEFCEGVKYDKEGNEVVVAMGLMECGSRHG